MGLCPVLFLPKAPAEGDRAVQETCPRGQPGLHPTGPFPRLMGRAGTGLVGEVGGTAVQWETFPVATSKQVKRNRQY